MAQRRADLKYLFGGRDGLDDRRAGAQIAALIDELEPDVFLMQEAKSFEAGGDALPHALEADQNARVPCREEIIGQARREGKRAK